MSNMRIRSRKIDIRSTTPIKRSRKVIEARRSDEYFSKEDLKEIHEGFDQIKRGECVSHDELKKLLGL